MDDNRITHRIFEYNYKLCKKHRCYDMKQLFRMLIIMWFMVRKWYVIFMNCNNIYMIRG